MVWGGVLWYGMVWYDVVWGCMTLYVVVWYDMGSVAILAQVTTPYVGVGLGANIRKISGLSTAPPKPCHDPHGDRLGRVAQPPLHNGCSKGGREGQNGWDGQGEGPGEGLTARVGLHHLRVWKLDH